MNKQDLALPTMVDMPYNPTQPNPTQPNILMKLALKKEVYLTQRTYFR